MFIFRTSISAIASIIIASSIAHAGTIDHPRFKHAIASSIAKGIPEAIFSGSHARHDHIATHAIIPGDAHASTIPDLQIPGAIAGSIDISGIAIPRHARIAHSITIADHTHFAIPGDIGR
jgi:hypothetical protein